ncbi:MAG: rRNA pseudouridine synthase [Oscillospiraceae bacterium]|nr:rRNA pseudouridine synthase [Oscillospiraceae bacterium]
MEERIQKVLSAQGFCSRREADRLLEEGKIAVNGRRAEPGAKIDPAKDVLHVNGKRVYLQKKVNKLYYILYKPRGYVTTLRDSHADKTVAELMSDIDTRLYPVGRLDKDSEGLLLMTNDGDFTNLITHPSGKITKNYRVSVEPYPSEEQLIELSSGVKLDDGFTAQPARIRVTGGDGSARGTLEIIITEGHNREIRRMCEAVGLQVTRLKRTAVGPLSLGNLKAGEYRQLKPSEIAGLRRNASGGGNSKKNK